MTITVMEKPMLKDGKTDAHVEKPIVNEGKAEQVSIRVSIPMFLRKLPLPPPRLRRVGSRFQPSSMEGRRDLSYWLKPWPMMVPTRGDATTDPGSSLG